MRRASGRRNGTASSGFTGATKKERRSEDKKVVLGLKSQLRKHEAEEKLRKIIQQLSGKTSGGKAILLPDDSVTFDWFVKEKYIPLRRGQWRVATRKKLEYEINHYLVDQFRAVPLREVGLFELQTRLNDLAERFSESISSGMQWRMQGPS